MTKDNLKKLKSLTIISNKLQLIILTLLISICTFMVLIFTTGIMTIDKYLNNVYDNFDARKIMVYKEDMTMDDINILKNIKHVNDAYYQSLDMYSTSVILDINFNNPKLILYNTSNIDKPEVVYGNKLSLNKSGEAICSEDFLPVNFENLSNFRKKDFIDKKDIINKTFTTSSGDTFKIIGLYDTSEFFTDTNICFINDKDMMKLKGLNKDAKDEAAFVIADNYKNLNSIKKDLSKNGYNDYFVAFNLDYNTINILHFILIITLVFCFMIILISITLFIKRNIAKRNLEIKLYRALGYNKTLIKDIVKNEYLLIIIFSGFITCILYIVGLIASKLVINNIALFRNFDISFNIIVLILFIIFNILLPLFIVNKCLKKYLNIDKICLEE